jgi:hypothetical protein
VYSPLCCTANDTVSNISVHSASRYFSLLLMTLSISSVRSEIRCRALLLMTLSVTVQYLLHSHFCALLLMTLSLTVQ